MSTAADVLYVLTGEYWGAGEANLTWVAGVCRTMHEAQLLAARHADKGLTILEIPVGVYCAPEWEK